MAKAGIYTDDNGSPDLLLVNSSEVTVSNGTTDWVDFALASTNLTSGADYWIAVIIGDQTMSYYYDAGSVDQSASDTNTYSSGFESEILLWLDSFNKSDRNDLGLSWNEEEVSSTLTIVSNELFISTKTAGGVSSRGAANWDKTYDTDHHFSKLIFKSETSGWGGPCARVTWDGVDSGNVKLYQAMYDSAVEKIDLYVYDNERLIVDGTVLDTYNVTLSDGDSVWIEPNGTTIEVKVNGSTVISEIDGTIETGQAGVASRTYVGGANNTATLWDNWAGGDIHTLWDREISMYVTYTAGAMATGNLGLTIVGAGR